MCLRILLIQIFKNLEAKIKQEFEKLGIPVDGEIFSLSVSPEKAKDMSADDWL